MRAWGDWPPGVRAVLVVTATTLFVVGVAWATLVGPDAVFTGPGPRPGTGTPAADQCIPLPVRTNADGSVTVEIPPDLSERNYCPPPNTLDDDIRRMVTDAEPPLWLRILVWAFEVAVLAAMVVAVAWVARHAVRALREVLRRREDDAAEVEIAQLPPPERLAAAIVADAADQDRLLREGEPRNAIVSAWLRFEVQGERAGAGRRGWETSSEYAIRILDLVSADTGAVNELAELYREARFSDHPVQEHHREAALAALARIRASLGVRP